MKRLIVALTAISLALVAQGATASKGFGTGVCDYPTDRPLPGSGSVRKVPAQYPTIQAAIDAASEGDTILIGSGHYAGGDQVIPGGSGRRALAIVSTPGLRIRGESRTGVDLDGLNTTTVGIEVLADRVVVENLTGHNYKDHAIHWTGVTGYWGRYLTTYNNGLYGLFAFGSRCGEFSYSYGSGNADSAFYIGECFPCDARIHHVDAQENGLGYSGTNAGGNLVIRDSIWKNNSLGIVPNSLDSEARPPQRNMTIGPNNIIDSNNNLTAPGVGIQALYYGVGIALAGGQSNVVYGNTITDNATAGVVLVPLPSNNVYVAAGNMVWGNTITHKASQVDSFDLAQGASSGPNNCWSDNEFGTEAPVGLSTIWSCDVVAGTWTTPPGGDPRVEAALGLGQIGVEVAPNEGYVNTSRRVAAPWQTWPVPTCADHASACLEQLSDNGTGSFDDDGAVDSWLPALGLDA